MSIPENSREIVYLTPITTRDQGPKAVYYRFQPNTVAIDVDAEDAQWFVDRGRARFATTSDRANLNGWESRKT